GVDRHRLHAGHRRGLHQGHLSRGVEHRDLRDHGPGAPRATGGALRPNGMTATVKDYVVAPPVSVAAAWPRHQMLAFAVMVGLLVIAPFVAYPVFLMKALCFALFACAFNLLIGYVGLLSFGHAAFLGAAGYVSAHSAKVWGLPPELAILAGTATAAGLGLVIGALTIRSRGIYFANITLAFVLSATLSGLAGGTKALVFQLASLTDVHWTMSGEVVLMTLLGGLGTVFGPAVGAFIVIGLEHWLAQLGSWLTIVQGAIFVV